MLSDLLWNDAIFHCYLSNISDISLYFISFQTTIRLRSGGNWLMGVIHWPPRPVVNVGDPLLLRAPIYHSVGRGVTLVYPSIISWGMAFVDKEEDDVIKQQGGCPLCLDSKKFTHTCYFPCFKCHQHSHMRHKHELPTWCVILAIPDHSATVMYEGWSKKLWEQIWSTLVYIVKLV